MIPGRFLVGTSAHNSHVQHMVRALLEADALADFVTGGVDVWRNPILRAVRRSIGSWLPAAGRLLGRRAVSQVPAEFVHPRWGWEALRIAALAAGASPEQEDWIWERGEVALDRHCARLISRPDVSGFLGVENGALESLRRARLASKRTVLAYLSPHHRTFDRWVTPEFDRYPELRTKSYESLASLAPRRHARQDEELALADLIVTNSSFTSRSVIDAGFPASRLVTVPLAGPDPVRPDLLPVAAPRVLRVAYVGPVSVRKGAHYLLQAWRTSAPPGAELHFYGKQLLPSGVMRDATAGKGGDRITFHGSVSAAELSTAYLAASVLVLPTLCDGFGLVVSEALAHGLPVITTRNAGAADLVTAGITGFVVNPADAVALAERLEWCAEHPDALFEMRRAALSAARRWTWTDYRRTFTSDLGAALTNVSAVPAKAAVGQ